MSALWIPVTLFSALLQALRTADQRKLVGEIGNNGANLARYAIGAPAALLALLALLAFEPLPHAGSSFYLSCLVGGIAQIAATAARPGSFPAGLAA